MTRDAEDLLAAEYVLGTLDDETRRQVDFRRLHDAGLEDAIRAWEERLHPLDAELTPVAPPAGLWDRIEADIDTSAPLRAVTIRRQDGEWRRLAEGVEKKQLLVDEAAGTESYLIRLAPGAVLAPHHHALWEECVMLEGEVTIGGVRLAAGDFHVNSGGTRHPPTVSGSGAVFYVRGQRRGTGG